ncbi:MAG: L,D-transpeptidase [Acidobacteria bacterium]|nr:L,D-transpeptidase [Acidobacteriota bacterium]
MVNATQNAASKPVRKIVVSIEDRKLALLEGDRVIKIWATAVGAESTPSPSGTYTIINRLRRPAYYHSGKVIHPGPSNPLGTRWLGLSLKGFGIHGTNVPGSIGRKASHGCIRMRNRDIEELFELVEVGCVVEFHSERNEYLAQIFDNETRQAPSSEPVITASSHELARILITALV